MKYTSPSQWFTPLLIIILVLADHTTDLPAQATSWTGATSNSWATATNWSNGVPSIVSGTPSDVTFGSGNATALTLGDGTYYLNSLQVNGTSVNYGVNLKQFGSTGTIVFQSATAGTNAILNFRSLNTTAPNIETQRDLGLSANLRLDSNVTLTHTSSGGTTVTGGSAFRRVYLDGIISGDAGMTIYGSSSSATRAILFRNHNTFAGDVYFQNGYVTQTYSDGLGAADKTIYFGGGAASAPSITWDLQANTNNTPIAYHLDLANLRPTQTVLIQAGSTQRQLEFTGNITGSSTREVDRHVLHLISQVNQQMIFSGETMDFAGRVLARYGSEIVVANSNVDGVAWENVSEVFWNENTAAGTHNSAFLLRGNHTFNGNITIADVTQVGTETDRHSIGQINHQGTSSDAIFNGNISVLEKDFNPTDKNLQGLNLVSESGGSATFNGNIAVVAAKGMNINYKVNETSSAAPLNYYETNPTGTVTISNTARVAGTLGGTDTIGLTEVHNGTLQVNSDHFYSDVTARSGARIAGTGKITGNVSVLSGGMLAPGSGTTNPAFVSNIGTLEVTGNVSLTGSAMILFQANEASFNVLDIASIPTLDSSILTQVGDHDFLSIGSDLSIAQSGSLRLQLADNYTAAYGDVFHLLDFNSLTSTVATPALWNLPDLSSQSLFWNFTYFESHGLIVVDAPLIWSGAADPDDNLWSNPDNWTSTTPSTNANAPSNVVFAGNDLNIDTLSLNGETYYLNSLTVQKAEYNSGNDFEKTLASDGTLVFKTVNGLNPSLTFYSADNPTTAPAAVSPRNLRIAANIVLEDDTTITRISSSVGTAATNAQRRVYFDGLVSGDGDLYIDPASNSSAGMIAFTNHNNFTGDVYWKTGYVLQNFADGLGDFDKTIFFGDGSAFTWDLTTATANLNAANEVTAVGYNLNFLTTGTRSVLIHTGSTNRQLVLSGDITGGNATTTVQLISQSNHQLIFTGEQMDFTGNARIRYGSEVVLANANASGVAWQNVAQILFNEVPTNANHNSAFLLRGNYTYNGNMVMSDTAEPSTSDALKNGISIGQINHEGTSHDATFNGNINILEDDYAVLNLVSESDGSATFNGSVSVTGTRGMTVNELINSASSFYETAPSGTVIFSATSRLASTAAGTDSIGLSVIRNGTLIVDTPHFYSDVEIDPGATLGGKGTITGNVYVSTGSQLNPGGSNNSPIGALSIVGNLDLESKMLATDPSSVTLDVRGATFNIGSTAEADITTVFASELQSVGDHDHLTITGAFTINDVRSITVNFLDNYLPNTGDAFNLLDFGFLNLANSDVNQETMWDLPNLSELNASWSWNYDLAASHGVVYIIVPEPQRALLLILAVVCLVSRRRRRLQ
ncbi:hypothetical protein FEM03_03650 [Phragmitibacter flavus]|uniref:PEP-CTERM sorting domain-containing protein n=1 Tax=Phragmitibacter flavus TaxID=2576071 RepID=A0A5R8KL98_9BACT|nr:hypothetical protein [Phragmitibacter flavus]TLD72459.1 hypothetical protein FEM03_03650 [Phragmitibacter flavus]